MRNDPKHAPRKYALVVAVLMGAIVEIMLTSALATGYGLHMAIIGCVTPIAIVLMTRRSPAAVTAIAVAIPKAWATIVAVIGAAALSGMQHGPLSYLWIWKPVASTLALAALVWFAATWSGAASSDLRREPGRRMPTRPWIPAVGLILLATPLAAGAMVSDRDVAIGVALAMIAWPLSSILLSTWIPSVLTDAIFARLAVRERERGQASVHAESMGDATA